MPRAPDLVELITSDEILDCILCHWEPSVGTLAHMLLVHRLIEAPKARVRLIDLLCEARAACQADFLGAQLEAPSPTPVEDDAALGGLLSLQPAIAGLQRY
jgi:hypothetical protein